MALDFPSNPADGQVYGNYIWSSSSGAWKSKPTVGSVTTHSPTAPATPNPGDIWFNTNDGTSFTYYDDGNTRQWVEMMGSGISNSPLSANYVINGAFDIWQRTDSGTVGATVSFAADHWQSVTYAGGTMSWSKAASGLPGISRYCLRLQRAAGATNTASLNIAQSFETSNVLQMAGKTMTLSYYARAGANYSAAGSTSNHVITWGTGTDQGMYSTGITGGADLIRTAVTLTTSWQRFTATVIIPATATSLGIGFYSSALVGTALSADYIEITGVQLEEGSMVTPFRRASPTLQAELAACQRYYEVVDYSSAKSPTFVTYAPNGDTRGWIPFMVTKRVAPTGTTNLRDTTLSTSSWTTIGVTGNATNEVNVVFGVGLSGATPYGVGLWVNTGLTTAWGVVSWGTNTGFYVYANAEF